MSPSARRSSVARVVRGIHRWVRRLATGVLLFVGLVIAAAVIIWSLGAEFLAARGTAYLNQRVLGPETRVTVEEVRGTPFRRLILAGVRIERTSPEGTYAFLSARELELTYDLWGLLHGRYEVARAVARGLELDFRMEGKDLLLPTFRKGSGRKKESPAPPFRIRKLQALDGSASVELPWRTVVLDSLSADLLLESGRDGLVFELGRLRGVFREGLGELALTEGALRVGSVIRLEDLGGDWAGSSIRASGPVAKAPLDLALSVERLPLARLGEFLENDDLEPGTVERAEGNLRVEGGRVMFSVEGAATWEPWTADRVEGSGIIENDILRLRDVEASIEGAEFSGVSLEIPLSEPPFRARGRVRNLDTATLRIPFFDSVPGTMSGSADIRFLTRKDLGRDFDLDVRAEAGVLLDVPFRTGRVVSRTREGVFTFDTLRVDLAGARAEAAGKTSAEFLDLDIAYRGSVLPLRNLLRREDAEGTASVRAALNGPPRSPFVIASGEIRGFAAAGVKAPLLVVEEAKGPVYENQELEIRARTPRGVTVGELTFAEGATELTVLGDSARVAMLTLTHGDSTVTAEGSFRWEPELRADITAAVMEADGRRFRFPRPFRLFLREDAVSTPGMHVETARGAMDLAGSWDFASRRFDVEARVLGVDPSVFFPPESPPKVAVGRVSGILELSGEADSLRGRAELGLREIDWNRGHLDSAYVEGTVDGGLLRIGHLMGRLGNGRVDVRGDLEFPEGIVPMTRGLREGRYPDRGRTRYRLEGEGSRIDLVLWKFLIPPGHRIGGRVDVRARLDGTSEAPRLWASGRVRGPSWRGFEADSIVVDALLDAGTVRIRDLWVWEENQSVAVSGDFPVDMVFLPFETTVPERGMDLALDARDGSLRGLELTPWIRKADGSLRAHLRVGGSPRRPLAEGWARVDGGRVELRERDEVVENITARFTMNGDLVRVEEARGILTVGWARKGLAGGVVTASGTYRLSTTQAQSYRLEIGVREGVVGEEGVYAGRVSGNVVLEPLPAPDGRLYPTARGSLFVHRLEYAGSLKPQDIAMFEPPSLLYEVAIEAPEKITVRTDQARAELGGDLVARRTQDRQVILGTLEILSGEYQFFQKTFRVSRGSVTWDSPSTRIPVIDIQAETKEAGYRIIADLQGRADQPEITFQAEGLEAGAAELSQDEIIQLLAFGAVGLSAPTEIAGSAESRTKPGETAAGWGLLGAEQLFGSEIERQILEQIGLSADVQVATESSRGEFEPKVGIRTYVTPELSLQYLQGLSRTYEQDVAVEYRLRRLVVLRGSVVNLPLESRQEYNLDLKLRHEY